MNSLSLFSEDQIHSISDEDKSKLQSIFSKITYNEEQTQFIESPLENSKLIGIPGGGKTQSVIGKILYHLLQNDFYKSSHYLILTFSKKTNIDFFRKIYSFFEDESLTQTYFHLKNIYTLHFLCKVLYDFILYTEKQNTSFEKETEIDIEDENIEINHLDTIIFSLFTKITENHSFLEHFQPLKDCKMIFIDESQDLSQIQYQFIMCIHELLHIPIIMIGDPNQNIYQFQKGSDYFLLNHPGPNYYLTKNYRSSHSIVEFLNHFRPWNEITPKMVSQISTEDNHKPILYTGSISQILENIVDSIKKSKYKRENIAIIGPVKRSKSFMNSYKSIGLSLISQFLQQSKIPYIQHYNESLEDYHQENDDLLYSREEGHVHLYTIHGAKGLEFDEVYVLNFHTHTYGQLPTEDKYKELKYLWYVGLSRAKYHMKIYIEDKKVAWYELKRCPKKVYQIENKPFYIPKTIQFKENNENIYHHLKHIMKNKNYFNDEIYFLLENVIQMKIKKEKFLSYDWDVKLNYLIHFKPLQSVYSTFIQHVYIYLMEAKQSKISQPLYDIFKMIEKIICIPEYLYQGYISLKKKIPQLQNKIIRYGDFFEYKKYMNHDEEAVLNYLHEIVNGDMNCEFICWLEISNTPFPKEKLEESLSILFMEKNNIFHLDPNDFEEYDKTWNHIISSLWNISLFINQLKNHSDTPIWNIDYEEEKQQIKRNVYIIFEYIKNNDFEELEYMFYKEIQNNKLPIIAEIDFYSNEKLIQFHFSKTINKKQIYELILNYYLDMKYDKKLECWNFYTGEKYKIELNIQSISVFDIYKILSKSIHKKIQNCLFLYDIEIINPDINIFQPNQIDIVQAHFEEFTTEMIPCSGYYQPCNPSNIQQYYDPQKIIEYGLSIETLKEDIMSIFEYCENPIFLSHHVELYDLQMLQYHQLFLNTQEFKIIDNRKLLFTLLQNHDFLEQELADTFLSFFPWNLDDSDSKNQTKMMKFILQKLNINETDLSQMMIV
jgi:hypothetical protein